MITLVYTRTLRRNNNYINFPLFSLLLKRVLKKLNSHLSRIKKPEVQKRSKIWLDGFKEGIETQQRRSYPVISLDYPDKNCSVCGYDHEHKTADNEHKYCDYLPFNSKQ